MRYVVDIETTSPYDLPARGSYIYAEHPDTHILCISWADADSDDEPRLWRCDSDVPLMYCLAELMSASLLIAHNANFERACLRRYDTRLGSALRWADSAMLSGAAGRPRALREACYSLCLPAELEKDARGKRLLNMFSIQSSKLYIGGPEADPAAFNELCEYCRQDVRAEREIWRLLSPLFYDRLFMDQWQLDCDVEDAGIPVDTAELEGARALYEYFQAEAECAASELTDGCALRSTPALRAWTAENGYALDSFARAAVDEALANRAACDAAPKVERLLRLRKAVAGTAGKKFTAVLDRTASDGRIHGALISRVAHTGRYAGEGIQPQNLPRGYVDAELLPYVRDVAHLAADDLKLGVSLMQFALGGQECDALASLCRDAIAAPEGKRFVVADYSAVEARVLAWLASERWVEDIFAGDGKIYERTAAAMYGRSVESITKHERMAGKIATLALGYGGSVGALKRFAEAYDVHWTDEEALEIVRSWRQSRPRTVALWRAVDDAFIQAVRTGLAQVVLGKSRCNIVRKEIAGRTAIAIMLPSGRKIMYWAPQIVKGDNGFDEVAVETYGSANCTLPAKARNAGMTRVYGGLLVENITQAVAFDLLLQSLLGIWRWHRDKCRIVMHIHDEIVVECDADRAEEVARAVRATMERASLWAPGLKLNAEPEIMERYKK